MSQYEPKAYWESLLSQSFDLKGVGWPDLSQAFNRWQYRARADSVRRCVPNAVGLRVLDVGSGTGFWIAFWKSLGSDAIWGLDLTETSIQRLHQLFPEDHFERRDITKEAPSGGPFDLISAIDVLLHVVDDALYAKALANLRSASRPGTRLILLEPVAKAPVPYSTGASSRARSLEAVRQSLRGSGWQLDQVYPAMSLLTSPVETVPRVAHALFALYWRALKKLVRSELAGATVGCLLYPADRLLCRVGWSLGPKILTANAA